MNAKDAVYRIVSQIPKGKVVTYGQVAKLAGIKNPRLVGSILHKNSDPTHIPCHRVVNAKGYVSDSYAFGGRISQINQLQKEGVMVDGGKVSPRFFLWTSPT